jgi:hypothetical protein
MAPRKPDRLQLEQHDVADHFFRQLGMHPQRERDVFEYIQVGKQRAALKQHAHMLARIEQIAARQGRQVLAVDPHFAVAVGRSCMPIRRSRVVLPQPDGPMIPVTLPRGNANIDVIEDAARTALEGNSLQLDRVGVIGTHLNSLRCSFCTLTMTWDKLLATGRRMCLARAELAANYITAVTDRPRPKLCLFRLRTVKNE